MLCWNARFYCGKPISACSLADGFPPQCAGARHRRKAQRNPASPSISGGEVWVRCLRRKFSPIRHGCSKYLGGFPSPAWPVLFPRRRPWRIRSCWMNTLPLASKPQGRTGAFPVRLAPLKFAALLARRFPIGCRWRSRSDRIQCHRESLAAGRLCYLPPLATRSGLPG